MVKGAAFAKFDETVDVAVRLGVDPRHADQVVRGTVVLPHGTGKSVRVLVIAQGDKAREAEAAGADFVGIEYSRRSRTAGSSSTSSSPRRTRWASSASSGKRARSPRPDAEPEGRHGDVGRRPRRSGRSRPARSSSGSTRPATCTPRSARCRSRRASSRTTSRRSWTRSFAPSRRRPRASTSARPRCRAPWARASGSTRRCTDEQDRAADRRWRP